MIRFAFIVVVVLARAAADGHAQDQAAAVTRDSASTEIGRIAERWLNAYNGTDADELTPLYTEDAVYISGHVAGLVAEGRDRVIENFRKGMATGGHLDGLEVISITHSCDVASVLCAYYANNSGQRVSGRTLLVLKTIHGQWLIAIHMTVV